MASTAPTTIRMIPRVHTMEILNTNPTISRMIPKTIMVCLFSFLARWTAPGVDPATTASVNSPLSSQKSRSGWVAPARSRRLATLIVGKQRRGGVLDGDTARVQDIEGGAGPVGVRVR